MNSRRNVQAVITPDGAIMVAIFPRAIGKRTRFYHYPSQASVVRLHKAIEALTHSGSWQTSPQAYCNDEGQWSYGWIAQPFKW